MVGKASNWKLTTANIRRRTAEAKRRAGKEFRPSRARRCTRMPDRPNKLILPPSAVRHPPYCPRWIRTTITGSKDRGPSHWTRGQCALPGCCDANTCTQCVNLESPGGRCHEQDSGRGSIRQSAAQSSHGVTDVTTSWVCLDGDLTPGRHPTYQIRERAVRRRFARLLPQGVTPPVVAPTKRRQRSRGRRVAKRSFAGTDMVDVRQCRRCAFPVTRNAAVCPKCRRRSPGYSEYELTVRRWVVLVGLVAVLALVAAFVHPVS